MANRYFPQLPGGAIAQYPIQKSHIVHTVKNSLANGSALLFNDGTGARRIWSLHYEELSAVELRALQAHFADCNGPYRAFTFIDPTDNMLCWSTDLTNAIWQAAPGLTVAAGAPDPTGGSGAFLVQNSSQEPASITQTVMVPANYQYCFSAYAASAEGAIISLVRAGSTVSDGNQTELAPQWNRLVSSGGLNDASTQFSVQIVVQPGQQASVFGVQLEAQLAPSRYRPTGAQSAVYPSAHWGAGEFAIVATAPDQFSTAFSIEASL